MSKDKRNSDLDFDFDLENAAQDTSVLEATQTAQPVGLAAPKAKPGRPRCAKQAFSLEWAAGFADGEGCIYIFKQTYAADPRRKATYRLGFTITQNDLQVLEHFQQGLGIGGRIYQVARKPQHNRQIYTLNCTGISALRVICTLQPHLIRKQLEAQTAIDYWQQGQCGKHPGPAGWPPAVMAIRERFCKKLKSLK